MVEDDPLALAAAWRADGHDVALATVVATWGSSPRAPGSQLVVRGDGVHQGSVSGGCIEGAVIEEALAVMADGSARRVRSGAERSGRPGSPHGIRADGSRSGRGRAGS